MKMHVKKTEKVPTIVYFKHLKSTLFKNNLKILSKYKCKVNNVRYKLLFSEDYLIIEGKDKTFRIPYQEIKQIRLKECFWAIRVKLEYKKEVYKLDFPSFKIATKFYEQLIYNKINVQIH